MERELIVIAKREAQLRVTREGITSVEGADVNSLANILASESAVMRPLFGINEEQIQARIASVAIETNADVPDLSLYYRVEAPDERLEELAARLREQGVVEAAYVKPAAELPIALDQVSEMFHHMVPLAEEAPSVSPDFTVNQAYLDAAPGGIDARYAWTQSGSGAGVGIIDIERAWRFTHEDLRQNQGGVVGGTQSTALNPRNHGTAVVGVLGSDRNTFGCTGICPDANVRAISVVKLGSAGAIRLAADMLNPGDIILIEKHRPGPRSTGIGQEGFIAIEWWPDDFDAIRYATSRGVIVVEAAGNGAENLDDPIYNTPGQGFPSNWTNPFNRTNRDSGAIVVGAGAPPPNTHGRDHGPDRSRLDFSNYGSLIDAQGWGREVTTCGYGDLQGGSDEDLWYTDTFGGTSSASPIVVGALACLQSILRSRGKSPVSPSVARNLLRSTGSPQQDAPGRPRNQRIGNRPNIREMLAEVTGKMSQLQPVLTFDGIDDCVEVPYTEKHNPKVFTISCWAKLTQLSTKDVVLVAALYRKESVYEGYCLFEQHDIKTWAFAVRGNNNMFTSSGVALNTWTHLAATFDGSKKKLYVNGQLVDEKEGLSYVVNTHNPLYIGAGRTVKTNVPERFLIGQMAEVCIWNKARTQQEIQSDMNKRLTGTEEGLVGYWPLNEGCGSTAIDKTGNGNNGIIKGGAIWKQQEISLEPAKPTTGKDTKTASGRTTPGATNWQVERSTTIYVDVDTSAAGFTTTPVYVTSIGGDTNHWRTAGGSSVYAATATGFRVFLRWDTISVNQEALTPADANNYKWHINWIGSEP